MPKYPKRVRKTQAMIRRAVKELDIKGKYGSAYHTRLVGNRLEFHVLGGHILYWPPVDAPDADQVDAAKHQDDPVEDLDKED